jgi:LysM repeat protein
LRGKSTFFFKVLMILTVHVVLIGGMLLQGCKDTKDTGSSTPAPDTAASSADTLPPVTATSLSNTAANTTQTPPPMQPIGQTPAQIAQQPAGAQMLPPPQAPAQPPAVIPAASTDTKEYLIASGDTLGAIAHKNGMSLKALMDANPGINPKKLQVKQKIQIPAGTNAVASTAGPGAAAPDLAAASGDVTTYTVKSGDTLSQIAKMNHTSYKKIMALNDLKTTSIRAGQKLKLPAPKTAGTETPAASTPIVPLQTAPPATTTAATASTTASN